jgi:superfamily II DNA/RNA helicase
VDFLAVVTTVKVLATEHVGPGRIAKGMIAITTAFSELGLSAKVLAAITAAGYTEPTPIQAKAIPFAVRGQDVLGIAQTGTGKTASFVLPMLTRLEQGRARARMPRSLILCPTRELAAQVAENFERYGVNHKLNLALLIGGVSFDEQNRKLDRGVDVLIATPGRLLDHQQRGKLLLTGVEILVIDEADRMLDMGFIPDIEKICSLLPPAKQTLFFSATMPPEIKRLVDRFLRNPERVEAAPQATAAATITQRFKYVPWDAKEKRQALRDWIKAEEVKNAIIFCNRKTDVDILFKSLTRHGFNAGCLHGDMDQHNRTATLEAFRAGTITLLAASDVAARGLDIPDVSHVFNFDVPVHAEDYVHRIGRTGRAGRKGFAATLVSGDDIRTLKEIEKMLKVPLEWVDGPPPEDAGEGRGKRRGLRQGKVRPEPKSGGRDPARVQERRERRSLAPEIAADGAETGSIAPLERTPRLPRRRVAVQAKGLGDQPEIGAEVAPLERTSRPAPSGRGPRRPSRTAAPRDLQPPGENREPRRSDRREDEQAPRRTPDRPREPRNNPPPVRGGVPQTRPDEQSERPATRRGPVQDDGPTVRGLGDHVPDFLRRQVKIRGE